LQIGLVANTLSVCVTSEKHTSSGVSEVESPMTEEELKMQYDSAWLQEAGMHRLGKS